VEHKFLALIYLSGWMGISIYNVAEIIWPYDIASIFQIENRVNQLISRCKKKFGCNIVKFNGFLNVDTKVNDLLRVQLNTLSFIVYDNKKRSNKRVQEFYNCSMSKAKIINQKVVEEIPEYSTMFNQKAS
jgi:hypothetical protein